MTTHAALLRPSLAALDLALADTAPGGKGQPAAPDKIEDACRLLADHAVALGQAARAACDAATARAPELPLLAATRYRLPADRAELLRLRPQRLACARHAVQAALRDAQRAEAEAQRAVAEAPQRAKALRDQAAADERLARDLASSIFWSQVTAAGLAVWLLG